ncbi:MAG: TrkH family potassium uptake protein [Alphaproteobacteria bacterium]|nr:TrkH family potassium uptake protein [Alphaproteobacteria bacterium]
MNNSIVGFTIGILLLIIGVADLIPAALDWYDGHLNYESFLYCSVVSVFFGGLLILSNIEAGSAAVSVRQTFLLTTLSWLSISIFASFPLYFSDLKISFVDAFFESISGVTTTGSTILSGLDGMSRGVLLWRSIIQWIGGIGIIAFAIIILPFLHMGSMNLFQTESSDRSDKVTPRTVVFVILLMQVYVLLTALCALTYYLLGMSVFDAINHALTTIPTGGYSTHDASFGYYKSPALQYAGALFMLAGGVPFILYVKFLFRGRADFFQDSQFKVLMMMLFVFIAFLTFWLWGRGEYGFFEAMRLSTFNIISVITTTGFATTDYTLWGAFAVLFFFFITFLGACTGSTAGGLKVSRLIVLMKVVNRQLKALCYPRGVFAMPYQGKFISNDIAMGTLGFLGLFVVSNTLLTILLSLLGLDFATAISGSATALANVGPGIGDVIGPAGNFASLPDAAKLLLCAGMLLGRLEIMTVFVIFNRNYWLS